MTDKQHLDIDPALIRDFVDEALDLLHGVESDLVKLEETPQDIELINAIFRPIHSIKGNSPFFGLGNIRTLAHDMESVLALVRSGNIPAEHNLITQLLRGVDMLETMLARTRDEQPELATPNEMDEVLAIVKSFLTPGTAPGTKPAQAPREQTIVSQPKEAAAAAPKGADAHRSIRVLEEHIDSFLAYVGELLVVGEMLSYLQKSVAETTIAERTKLEFRRLNEAFHKLSNDLQRSIMSIRKQPLNNVLQKFSRIVRDIAQAKGKEVKLSLIGENIEVDKSILELLDAPLTHIVRNAVDHGIETITERTAAKKSSFGTVWIKAEENDTTLIIRIEDDGQGINFDALRNKGIENGLLRKDGSYSEQELINLIFMPGVSTAKEVTDISGRGVGMDVVKRAIEQAGGTIHIDSVRGQGSSVVLTLNKSVSTQIIEGFVFEIAGNCYIIPLHQVKETLHYASDLIQSVVGKGYFLERQGVIMPIIPVANCFSLKEAVSFNPIQLFVSITSGDHTYALQVDDVLGVQQIVLKKIDLLDYRQDLFTGSALLGDGRLALVLDLDRLCREFSH